MGGNSNNIDMSVIIEDSREYWEACLVEFEEDLQREFAMQTIAPDGFNDNMIQLLKFEIEECIKQLA